MLNLFRRLRSRASALLLVITVPLLLLTSLLEPDGDGGEGSGGEGEGEGGSGEGSGGGDEGGDGSGEGSFRAPRDQAEFDRMIKDRIKRERSKFGDYDDLKAKAAKLDEIEAANKTELEKAQEKARLAEEAVSSSTTKAQTVLKRAAVLVAATKAGAADPSDVWALLSDTQRGELTIDDDDEVSGADELVKNLLAEKPHLVGKKQTSGSADGGTREGSGEKPKNLGEAVAAHYAKT